MSALLSFFFAVGCWVVFAWVVMFGVSVVFSLISAAIAALYAVTAFAISRLRGVRTRGSAAVVAAEAGGGVVLARHRGESNGAKVVVREGTSRKVTNVEDLATERAKEILDVSSDRAFKMLDEGSLAGTAAEAELRMLRFLKS